MMMNDVNDTNQNSSVYYIYSTREHQSKMILLLLDVFNIVQSIAVLKVYYNNSRDPEADLYCR